MFIETRIYLTSILLCIICLTEISIITAKYESEKNDFKKSKRSKDNDNGEDVGVTNGNVSGHALNHVINDTANDILQNKAVFGVWDDDMTRLRKDLLKRYDKNNRPVDRIFRNTTQIYLYFFMRYINDFDEVAGHLKSTVGIQAYWMDTRLAWNPKDYHGFNQSLTFNLKELWVPHVTLWNPVDSFIILDPENDQLMVAVDANEPWVHYLIGGVVMTHCVPNVRYFPFDTHTCEINLVMYESVYFFHGIQLSISDTVHLKYEFVQHPRWKIQTSISSVEYQMGLSIAKFPYILQRRPLFMLFNLIIPILLLSFLNVCVFAIPIQSGERTSFSITVFLALAVFMTVVADHVPHSSDPIPLWSVFLLFKLLFSACIALFSTTVIRLYNRDESRPIPTPIIWITSLWNKIHDTHICRKGIRSREYNLEDHGETENKDSSCTDEDWSNNSDVSQTGHISWHHAAYVIDKLCLFIFLLIALTETTVTFIITIHNVNV